jgi:hypothetical protein
MSDLGFWPKLVLGALATWRLTHLLALEDGPGDVFVLLRTRLGNSFFGKLMDCFQCLSIWVAAPLALLVSGEPLNWLLAWLALSGAACLLERLGQQPVVIEPLEEKPKGDTEHGMLRTGSSDAAQRGADAGQPSPGSGGPRAIGN